MKYAKLNINWNADPNAPMPEISNDEDGINLSFFLNSFVFEHIDDGDKGVLEFQNVHKYRLGATNDEGYFNGHFRYTNKQLPWGEFYELKKSNWQKDFPDDVIVLNDNIKKKGLRHFIFFFKDETFECIATDYSFLYTNSVSDVLFEKYPKGYFSHYLKMFASSFGISTTDNFKSYIDLYIQMESLEELKGVKQEIKQIKKDNDLQLFLKLANEAEIENFGSEQLHEMIKIVENYKVK